MSRNGNGFAVIAFNVLLFSMSSAYAIDGNGHLACSSKSNSCGFIVKCSEKSCELKETHTINNGFPELLKPQYMQSVVVEKSNLYVSAKTFNGVESDVKLMLKNQNSKALRKYQKICYDLKYENVTLSETRCGNVIVCNDTKCQVKESHAKSVTQLENGNEYFTLTEIPYHQRVTREINVKDIQTDNAALQDLLMWEMIRNSPIKLLL